MTVGNSKSMYFKAIVLVTVGIAAHVTADGVPESSNKNTASRSTRNVFRSLRICAFNIKTFGVTKMGDPVKAAIIRDIVLRYDIILIQEIRDASGTALQNLYNLVGNTTYGLAFSDRLGRSSYKEQYAFFYRLNRVQIPVNGTHQFDDGPDDYTDVFEREPFSVRFSLIEGNWDFVITAIHVKPGDAVAEIGNLTDVYDDVKEAWSDIQNVIIMGDLNADCSYANENHLAGLAIYNQTQFKWVLGFDADTTTSTNSNCAYDRFILSGPNLLESFVNGSQGIYQFENTHNLSYDEMKGISDHYPIEIEFY